MVLVWSKTLSSHVETTIITTEICGHLNEVFSEREFQSAINDETKIFVIARVFEDNSSSEHIYVELILYQLYEYFCSSSNPQCIISSEKHFILIVRFLLQITSFSLTPVQQPSRYLQADYLLHLCHDWWLSRQHTISMLLYLERYIIVTKAEAYSSMHVGDYNT